MMLAARFQPRLQATVSSRRNNTGRRMLPVVAFKNGDEEQQATANAKVTFQLPLHVEWGQEVALVGEAETLGGWDVDKSLAMSWHDGDYWTAEAELPIDTPIQYKYIIRAAEGEVKAVLQWQPCNNMEVAAEQPELTIRDAWQGEQHEVLPGTLPVPIPPEPVAVEEEVVEAPPAAFAEEPVVAAVAPEVVDAVAPETPAPAPVVQPEAPAAASAVVDTPVEAAPATATTTTKPMESVPAPPVAAATPAPAAPAVRRRSTTSRGANGAKPAGGNSTRAKVVAAATTAESPTKEAAAASPAAPPAAARVPGVQYGSLSTNELKEVCKDRGLSTKGQRKDILSRLQQFLQQNRKA